MLDSLPATAIVPSCAIIAFAAALSLNSAPRRSHSPGFGSCTKTECAPGIAVEVPSRDKAQAYFRCANKATRTVLSPIEAQGCATKYLEFKLSFLPNISLEDFEAMSPIQRSETNRLSYLLYLKWQKQKLAERLLNARASP